MVYLYITITSLQDVMSSVSMEMKRLLIICLYSSLPYATVVTSLCLFLVTSTFFELLGIKTVIHLRSTNMIKPKVCGTK